MTGAYLDGSGQACEIQWDIVCVQCGVDEICVNNTLLHCPAHSSAPQGSGDVHDCVCGDGFYGVFHHEGDDGTLYEHDG